MKVLLPLVGARGGPWGHARIACRGRVLWVLLLWLTGAAQAVPIAFADRQVQLTAREQPIGLFLQDLFGLVDLPVLVSPSVKGAVNGSFRTSTWRHQGRPATAAASPSDGAMARKAVVPACVAKNR